MPGAENRGCFALGFLIVVSDGEWIGFMTFMVEASPSSGINSKSLYFRFTEETFLFFFHCKPLCNSGADGLP